MSIQAKFTQKCKKCGVQINAGDSINKTAAGNWCSNPTCGVQAETVTTPAAKTTTAPVPAGMAEFAKIHDAAWNFAASRAAEIWTGADQVTQRSILTQVIYKKAMDYIIHKGGGN